VSVNKALPRLTRARAAQRGVTLGLERDELEADFSHLVMNPQMEQLQQTCFLLTSWNARTEKGAPRSCLTALGTHVTYQHLGSSLLTQHLRFLGPSPTPFLSVSFGRANISREVERWRLAMPPSRVEHFFSKLSPRTLLVIQWIAFWFYLLTADQRVLCRRETEAKQGAEQQASSKGQAN
jgi:hypothetical protein